MDRVRKHLCTGQSELPFAVRVCTLPAVRANHTAPEKKHCPRAAKRLAENPEMKSGLKSGIPDKSIFLLGKSMCSMYIKIMFIYIYMYCIDLYKLHFRLLDHYGFVQKSCTQKHIVIYHHIMFPKKVAIRGVFPSNAMMEFLHFLR